MGTWKHLDWCGATYSGIGALRVPFLGQIDQNAPSQPWVDQKSNKVKILPR